MRKLTKIIAGLAVAIAVAAIAAFLWWSDEGPEAVDLETAVAQMEPAARDNPDDSSVAESDGGGSTTSSTDPPTLVVTTEAEVLDDARSTEGGVGTETTSTTSPAPVAEPTDDVGATSSTRAETSSNMSSGVAADDVREIETETTSADAFAGLWTLAKSENADGLPGEPAVSFVGFRVVEVLAGGVAESTAVGRTAEVVGSIELSGALLVAATMEVEIATLRTDNSHRDSHMRQALETDEFPLAVFTLVEPLELPIGVFEGETFSGPAEGDLTIKGVTNRAVFDLSARLVGDTIVAVGSSEVVFGDYGVTAPTSASVISVEDHGVMEFLLYFTR